MVAQGVPPAIFVLVSQRKTAGGTPALPNRRPKSHLDEIEIQAVSAVKNPGKLCELQEGPQISNVLHVFEAKYFLDHACRVRRTEDGRHEIARFSDDFLAGHRI